MAARLRKSHQDEVRAKIQASQLINVLQNHALGKVTPESPAEMPLSRMKAIEILLRKSIPDLSAVTLTGGEGGPIQVEAIERRIVDPAK